LTKKLLEQMKEPGYEAKVGQWYNDHLEDRYTYKDDKGEVQIETFAANRKSIENDYFEYRRDQMRAELIHFLRQDRKIEIDEKRLEMPG
jgi:hypothetical protein